MPDREANSPAENQPLVLVPVSAEDFDRRNRRTKWIVTFVVIGILVLMGYTYKRYLDPMHAQESFDAGTRLFDIARYNQAILSFDRAVALKPDMVKGFLMRGRAHVGNAEPELAIVDFTKVTELRPGDATGWIARGAAYLELNKFDEAIADATKAIAINPKEDAAYSLRGSAVRKRGDSKKALDDFTKAVELKQSPDNYYQRGACYQLIGDHSHAIEDFTAVIAMIPDGDGAYRARAESYRATGNMEAASEDRRKAAAIAGQ